MTATSGPAPSGGVASPAGVPGTSIGDVRARVAAPAIAMLVYAAPLLLALLAWTAFLGPMRERWPEAEAVALGPYVVVQAVVGLVLLAAVVVGSIRMLQTRSHRLALTAAVGTVLTAMPLAGGGVDWWDVIPAGIGIWALVVLLQPTVRAAFRARAALGPGYLAVSRPPLAPAALDRARRRIALVALVLILHSAMSILESVVGVAVSNLWFRRDQERGTPMDSSVWRWLMAFHLPALLTAVFVLIAGIRLMRRKGLVPAVIASVLMATVYPVALALSVLAATSLFVGPFIPLIACGGLVSALIGLWAFVMLLLPTTRDALVRS